MVDRFISTMKSHSLDPGLRTDILPSLRHEGPDDKEVHTKHNGVDPEQPPPSQDLDGVSPHDGTQGGADHRGESVEGDRVTGLRCWYEIGDGPGDIAQGCAETKQYLSDVDRIQSETTILTTRQSRKRIERRQRAKSCAPKQPVGRTPSGSSLEDQEDLKLTGI